jgi:hypothetical protein
MLAVVVNLLLSTLCIAAGLVVGCQVLVSRRGGVVVVVDGEPALHDVGWAVEEARALLIVKLGCPPGANARCRIFVLVDAEVWAYRCVCRMFFIMEAWRA